LIVTDWILIVFQKLSNKFACLLDLLLHYMKILLCKKFLSLNPQNCLFLINLAVLLCYFLRKYGSILVRGFIQNCKLYNNVNCKYRYYLENCLKNNCLLIPSVSKFLLFQRLVFPFFLFINFEAKTKLLLLFLHYIIVGTSLPSSKYFLVKHKFFYFFNVKIINSTMS
jgi:hypothetical protein